MERRESSVYGTQVLALLEEARETLTEKYQVTLTHPVTVEIFPQQEDFAIRTFGLPGGSGYLGVCFGNVVTANSPASAGAAPSNWHSVLWHEFCHVVTLHKTNNRMPRWLSEGISVYEERQRDRSWGEYLTPTYREMMLGDDLVPVSELSAAFLRPPTPIHLQFAYYESSLVVEYLIDTYGFDTMLKLLDDLAIGVPINTALARHTQTLAELDTDFAEHARQVASSLGSRLDWERDGWQADGGLDETNNWLEAHPNNYWGLTRKAQLLLGEDDTDGAASILHQLAEFFPEDRSATCASRQLAEVYRRQEDLDAEYTVLDTLARQDGDAIDDYIRLAKLARQRDDWAGLIRQAERILAVNPLLTVGQEGLAEAAERLGQPERVIEARSALIELAPADPAANHYHLAEAYFDLGQVESARRHTLISLERAPRYGDALRLLLRLSTAPPSRNSNDEVVGEEERDTIDPIAIASPLAPTDATVSDSGDSDLGDRDSGDNSVTVQNGRETE